jgi:predicted GNAT family acetyltransferase
MDITIHHKNENTGGLFYIEQDGVRVARMTYYYRGKDQIVIDYTEVIDKFQEQGLAKQLLVKAVDFARQNNLKIIPHCSFVRVMFVRMEEYHDVAVLI